MNKQKSLKKQLGSRYTFVTCVTKSDILRLRRQNPSTVSDTLVASLTVGCLRIDAVLYPAATGVILGYDLFVKDCPDSPDWICYDNLPDPVEVDSGLAEREMFRVLDRCAEEKGLSYTECNFETVSGKTPRQDKSGK